MPFLKHSESTKKEQLIFTLATIKVEVQLKNACTHTRCGHVRNWKLRKFFLHVFIHLYENLHQRKFPTIRYHSRQQRFPRNNLANISWYWDLALKKMVHKTDLFEQDKDEYTVLW